MIVFFLFGLSIATFLFLLTLIKRNKNTADYILAIWMGLLTFHLALFVMDYYKVTYEHPHLLGLLLPLPVLHGFFLYWYTVQTTRNRFIGIKAVFLHLTPFLLLTILAIPFYSMSGEEKLQVYLNHGRGFEWYKVIQMSLIVVMGLAYSVASIVRIKKHRLEMMNVFSNHEKKTLVWLQWMSLGLGSIWLLTILFDDRIIFSGVVLFVLFIGVFGINQTPVFFTTADDSHGAGPVDTPNPSTDDKDPGKYQKSGLTDDDATRLLDALETVMQLNKPYKNPDITLDELAALLKVHPHQLSQVINSRIGKTFYHYINAYRIKEFLALAALPDSRKLTYLGLATDCGFQSKTTFNKYFKLETGKTPSEYFQVATAA